MLPSLDRARPLRGGSRGVFAAPNEGRALTQPESPLKRIIRTPTLYIALVVAGGLVLLSLVNRQPPPDKLDFTEFSGKVAAGDVSTAKFLEGSQTITGTLSDGQTYEVNYPSGDTQADIVGSLEDADVQISVDPQKGPSILFTLIQVVLPVALLAGVLLWIMNRSQGGGGRVMQFGRSKAKLVTKDQPKTTFADVAGVDEAIEELEEVKDYLKSPSKFQAMGAKIPGRAPVRSARHRQDLARPRRCRRGRRPVLLDQRVGVRGDVRRRRCGARPRPVRAGEGGRPRHRVHR